MKQIDSTLPKKLDERVKSFYPLLFMAESAIGCHGRFDRFFFS